MVVEADGRVSGRCIECKENPKKCCCARGCARVRVPTRAYRDLTAIVKIPVALILFLA